MRDLHILLAALKALRRNVMRSALTTLGIVIGIAAVITMMEIGRGSANTIQSTIASMGANIVNIDPSDLVKAGVHMGTGVRVTLTPADSDAIERECSAVRWAAPSVDIHGQIIYGNRNWNPDRVLGTTPEYLRVRNLLPLAEGVPFTDRDVTSVATVCLVGQTVVRNLFDGVSPVGKEIRVNNVDMKVIGVLPAKGANMMGRDQDDYVITPWTTLKFRLSGVRQATMPAAATTAGAINTLSHVYPSQVPVLYPAQSVLQAADYPQMTRFTDIDDIFASVYSSQDIPLAIRQITFLLRERHKIQPGQPDDFRIRDLTEISKALSATSGLMTNLLLGVALISLLVGGVGIMNIMLVSVTERTREIGLRMAVGARPRDILLQFLGEAAVLCLIGGVTGIALGWVGSSLLTRFLGWPTQSSVYAVVAAVMVSVSVGVFFGFYPAWRGSRLDPIEALRYE